MKTQFKVGDKVRRKKEYLTHGDWTYGERVLTINKITPHGSIRFLEVNTLRTDSYFELAKEELNLNELLIKGKSYLCKELQKRDGFKLGFLPKGVEIRYRGDSHSSSVSVIEYFEENPNAEYCVILSSDHCSYPLEWVEDIKEKEVKLNDKYTAKVVKDTVVVGCQTFTREKIEEVLQAMKSFD